jgi:hypothetical protein
VEARRGEWTRPWRGRIWTDEGEEEGVWMGRVVRAHERFASTWWSHPLPARHPHDLFTLASVGDTAATLRCCERREREQQQQHKQQQHDQPQ